MRVNELSNHNNELLRYVGDLNKELRFTSNNKGVATRKGFPTGYEPPFPISFFFYKNLRKHRLKNHVRANDKWEREYPSPTPNHLGWTLGRKVRFRNPAGSRGHVKAAFSPSVTFLLFPSQLYHSKEIKFLRKLARKSRTLLQFRHLTL